MFYKRYIYDGTNNVPLVNTNLDETHEAIDKDIQKVLKTLPLKDILNNEASFWLDDICQSFAYLVIYTIIGKGFKVLCDKKKDEEIIYKFNRHININGQTIEDYIVDVWIDNLNHALSLWRISKKIKGIDNEPIEGIDLQRISPETIEEVREPVYGWRKFIQTVSTYGMYKNPEDFIKEESVKMRPISSTIIIPDDQRLVAYCSLFRRPPMYSVVPYVILKYIILTFIRKFSEKSLFPPIIAKVGDKNQYPNGPVEMANALSTVKNALLEIKNFFVAAIPGNTDVKQLEIKGDQAAYIAILDKMDQHIMFGLFSSIAARETTGVYKGNQLADESTVRFMEGIRTKIENTLKRLYIYNLPISSSEEGIHFIWPELRSSSVENLTKVLDVAVKSGVFKNAAERRRAFAQVITFLSETDLTKEDDDRLQKELITILAPSQPGVTSAEAAGRRKSSRAKKAAV